MAMDVDAELVEHGDGKAVDSLARTPTESM